MRQQTFLYRFDAQALGVVARQITHWYACLGHGSLLFTRRIEAILRISAQGRDISARERKRNTQGENSAVQNRKYTNAKTAAANRPFPLQESPPKNYWLPRISVEDRPIILSTKVALNFRFSIRWPADARFRGTCFSPQCRPARPKKVQASLSLTRFKRTSPGRFRQGGPFSRPRLF